MASEHEELFNKALKLIETGKTREALEILRKLVENMPSSIYEIEARYLSYYGYLTGIVSHNYKRGIELCNEAIKREFFHPDFYLNLGRLYLDVNNRNMAVKTFYKGLKVDKKDKGLLKEINKLGIRKRPVFPFWDRQHTINKIAGKMRELFYRKSKGEK